VGLFSFYEGLPNAVCEGMACQKPILLSDVCDAGSLVVDGENGFLCDPASPQSIAQAFQRLASASEEQLKKMGLASRRKAEALFAEEVIISFYERVLEAAAVRRPPPGNCTWPTSVPQSAFRTLERWQSDKEV
jgi:glycosyltransferase involved in cell wall biosynthesis